MMVDAVGTAEFPLLRDNFVRASPRADPYLLSWLTSRQRTCSPHRRSGPSRARKRPRCWAAQLGPGK